MNSSTKSLGPLADKSAIGLSLLCALHCLLLPVAVATLPAVSSLGLDDEAFHLWLVVVVLPISAFALLLGCRKHGRMFVLAIGGLGLAVLVSTPLLGHALLGESGERLLTLTGALLIAVAHVKNYRLCRSADSCERPE